MSHDNRHHHHQQNGYHHHHHNHLRTQGQETQAAAQNNQSGLGENESLRLEVFQLNKKSTEDDLEKCIAWLRSAFAERQIQNISVIVRRAPEYFRENFSMVNNSSLQGYSKISHVHENARHVPTTHTPTHQSNLPAANANPSAAAHNTVTPSGTKDPAYSSVYPNTSTQSFNAPSGVFNNDNAKNQHHAAAKDDAHHHDQGQNAAARGQGGAIKNFINKDATKAQTTPSAEEDEITSYYNSAQEHYTEKRHSQAIEFFRKTLQLCEKAAPDSNKYVLHQINAQYYLGQVLINTGDWQNGVKHLKEAVQLIEAHPHKKNFHLQLRQAYSMLGAQYAEQKLYDETIKAWKEVINIIEHEDSEDKDKSLGHYLNHLGLAYSQVSDYKNATKQFKKSIEIYKKLYGVDDIGVGNRLNNLAEAYRNKKKYQKALDLFQESLRIKRLKYKDNNERPIANTLGNIGATHANMNMFEKAIPVLNEAITIYQRSYSEPYTDEAKIIFANLYQQLGDCYKGIKDYKPASQQYGKAYTLKVELFSLKNKTTIELATKYAQSLYQSKQLETAADIFQKILEGQKAVYGDQHNKVGQTLNNLGTVLSDLKRYEDARTYISEAIKIFESDPAVDKNFLEKSKKNLESIEKRIKKQQQSPSPGDSKNKNLN